MEIRDDGITYVTELEAMLMGFYPQYLPKGWKIMEFRSDDNPEKAAEIERLQAEKRLEVAKRYAEQNPNDKEGAKDLQEAKQTVDLVTQPKPMGEVCRIAKRAYAREYYLRHREKIIQQNRKFREKLKEKKPDYFSSKNRDARRQTRLQKELKIEES